MTKVSIIIPCYNEQATIRSLLDAIYWQTYPREWIEVIIADGLSQDRTREVIAAFHADCPDLNVRVVDNTLRSIPSGLNRAIEHANGEIIIRLDAHCMPYPDYVAGCVKALEEGRGANVGGVWEIRAGADTRIAESIAAAAAHPLGVGDALYRHANYAAEVDTVPFGAYHRPLIDQIGKYDESLLTNEDYEFNARVRKSGGRVWLDPSIRSVYFARSTFGTLAKQYWRYGFWKWRMLRRYPNTLRWRQGLPPLFVLSLFVLLLLSIFIPLARWALVFEISIYVFALLIAGLQLSLRRRKLHLLFGLPLSIAVMHLSWGGAFLWSILTSSVRKNG